MTRPNMHNLIGAIYDAALDDTGWASVVDRIMQKVDASSAWLFTPKIDQIQGTPEMLVNHAQENIWTAYLEYYWQYDLWWQNTERRGLSHSGAIIHGDALISRDQFRRTSIAYSELLKEGGIEVLLATIIFDGRQEQAGVTGLSLFRPPGAEAFSREDEYWIQSLLSHFQRALRIRRQMMQALDARCLRENTLDQISQAVALLDQSGRVVFANHSAESIFRESGGPTVINNCLTTSDGQMSNQIKEALRLAKSGLGCSVRLNDLPRQRYWIATFNPLGPTSRHGSAGVRILVLISCPDHGASNGLHQFARLYALTPAETRVLQYLLDQKSTQDIADALAIGISTLRTHLKHIFSKTATSNQRELVRFFFAHPFIYQSPFNTI